MDVQSVTTSDGVRIAYSVSGHGPPLVYVRGWISNIERMWDDPPFHAYFGAIGEHFTVIRFDMRGNGLSDRGVTGIDLRAMVADIEAVVDEAASEPIILYGQCFGGPASIAYAARHPGRVARLVLDGTYAEGQRVARPERQRQIVQTLKNLPEAGLAFLTHLTHPNPGPSKFRQHEQDSSNVSAETAVELYTLGFAVNVTTLLPRLTMPTLVMHRANTRAIPFRLGAELAELIAGARFVSLEGQAHNPWEEFPEVAIGALAEFLDTPLHMAASDADDARRDTLLTVVHIELPATPVRGNRKQPATVERAPIALASDAIAGCGGQEVARSRSSLTATFGAVADALECTITLQRALEHAGGARIGVDVGEGLAQDRDVSATAVELTRELDAAGVIITADVREMCAGQGFQFTPRAALAVGPSGDPVELFDLRWRAIV